MMIIEVSSLSDIGKVRDDNEDCLIISDSSHLYALTDGMGGLAYGKVAAEIVRDQMLTYFQLMKENNVVITCEVLEKVIKKISEYIQKMGNVFGGCTLYGATLTGLVINDEKGFLMNVGDSRVYRYNQEGLVQLTKDQNLLTHLIDTGKVTEEQRNSSLIRNVVLEYMGKAPFVKPNISEIDIKDEDVFCICSDGLFDTVEEKGIEDILMSPLSLDEKCNQLVKCANDAGGKDNISVILVKIRKE